MSGSRLAFGPMADSKAIKKWAFQQALDAAFNGLKMIIKYPQLTVLLGRNCGICGSQYMGSEKRGAGLPSLTAGLLREGSVRASGLAVLRNKLSSLNPKSKYPILSRKSQPQT